MDLSGLHDDVFGGLGEATDWLGGVGQDAFDWTAGAGEDAFDWTVGAGENAIDWTVDAGDAGFDWTVGAGTDFFGGLEDGINWMTDGDNWEALGKTLGTSALLALSGDFEAAGSLLTNEDLYTGEGYDEIERKKEELARRKAEYERQ